MSIRMQIGVIAIAGLAIAGCAAPAKKRLVDPFPLRFPLIESGTLEIEGHVVGQPRAQEGIVYFATREGFFTAVVIPSRAVLWRSKTEHPLPSSMEPASDIVILRDAGLLQAFDVEGKPVWEFKAGGAIEADPAQAGGRVYFGDSERKFYCLDAATGKVKWQRRLQGAPIHPAIIRGRTVAVAASNSVVYLLSRKGGSILSWESIPSRIVFEPFSAGRTLLVSSAAESLLAFDLETGKSVGQHILEDPAVAGPLWIPPYVVLFEETSDPGRQRMVMLRSR